MLGAIGLTTGSGVFNFARNGTIKWQMFNTAVAPYSMEYSTKFKRVYVHYWASNKNDLYELNPTTKTVTKRITGSISYKPQPAAVIYGKYYFWTT